MKLKDIKAEVYERGQYLVTFKDKRTKARQLAALERDNYGVELHTRFLDGSELWQVFGDKL